MDSKHYPTAFLLVIALALYFMYGDQFSLKNIDFAAYQELCEQYRSAKPGVYSKEEIQGLINKVNYLLPDDIKEIQEPLKKEIKSCAIELAEKISSK